MPTTSEDWPICPLCLRPIPAHAPQSLHHLVPRAKGGKGGPTVLLHHLCHKEIHARFAETELARRFPSIEAIRTDGRMAAFLGWVAKRPPEFLGRTRRQSSL